MSEPPPGRPDFQPPSPPPPPPPPPPAPPPPILLTEPPTPFGLPVLSGPVSQPAPPPPDVPRTGAEAVEGDLAAAGEEWGNLKRVLVITLHECRLEGYRVLTDAHLLLGLLAEDDQVTELLQRHGVRASALRKNWAHLKTTDPAPYRLYLVALMLRLAVEDAARRGQDVATAHLLAAMLRDERDLTTKALRDLKVDPAAVRAEVGKLVDALPQVREGRDDPDFIPDYVLPVRGSSCLGIFLGASGVGLAVAILNMFVDRKHLQVAPEFWPTFHIAWAVTLTVVGGVLALFPRQRRTGLGIVFLSIIGYLLALWGWFGP